MSVSQEKKSPDNNTPAGTGGLLLGIDTGGTYTDAVLLDYQSRHVLVTHKSLTTRRNLAIGIDRAIQGINITDPAAVKLVSVSTTLATNTIAEGKGRAVALFLIGYDPDLVQRFSFDRRFATPHYFFIAGGHNHLGEEKAPLDRPGLLSTLAKITSQVDALAVSAYFSPLNTTHEHEAFELISTTSDLPVVLGHQLSTRLNSIDRATTAALNASLIAILKEFVEAVQETMSHRGIRAPLMVVRGDGTMVRADIAGRAPVETIHSGPAASAIGGRFLCRRDDALVIDIGGTTTDIALVQQGQVSVDERGANVGDYRTAVQAAALHSIALGGDSHLTLTSQREILLGPERVVPLAFLAQEFPMINQWLGGVGPHSGKQDTPQWLNYWFLRREPRHGQAMSGSREQELVELLRDGPRPVPNIMEQLGLFHPSQLQLTPLLRHEIIGQAGLTPTDLLHLEGRFKPWDGRASELAVKAFCAFWSENNRWHFPQPGNAETLCHQVWTRMTRTIVRAVVSFLTGQPVTTSDDAWWFVDNSLEQDHPFLETSLRLQVPLIGLGAPAGAFLPPVARALNTELLLPDHYQVANAVGAVAASVMVTEEILIYPRLSAAGLEVLSYILQGGNGYDEQPNLEAALQTARGEGQRRAIAAALEAGAEQPECVVEEVATGLDSYHVRIRAVGNPRLDAGQ